MKESKEFVDTLESPDIYKMPYKIQPNKITTFYFRNEKQYQRFLEKHLVEYLKNYPMAR